MTHHSENRADDEPAFSAENLRQVQYDDGSWSRTLEGPIFSRGQQDAETMNAMAHYLRQFAKSPEGDRG